MFTAAFDAVFTGADGQRRSEPPWGAERLLI
jgi:hypothetical protein